MNMGGSISLLGSVVNDPPYLENLNLWSQMTIHKRTNTDNRPFACTKCQKLWTSKKSLNQHLIIHSEKNTLGFYCDKSFSRKYNLNKHLFLHSTV